MQSVRSMKPSLQSNLRRAITELEMALGASASVLAGALHPARRVRIEEARAFASEMTEPAKRSLHGLERVNDDDPDLQAVAFAMGSVSFIEARVASLRALIGGTWGKVEATSCA